LAKSSMQCHFFINTISCLEIFCGGIVFAIISVIGFCNFSETGLSPTPTQEVSNEKQF
jgi:hypothetical protein